MTKTKRLLVPRGRMRSPAVFIIRRARAPWLSACSTAGPCLRPDCIMQIFANHRPVYLACH